MKPGTGRIEFSHWIVLLLTSTTFLLLSRATWRKWPDVVVDFGHELYIPWRLTEGDALYRDIEFPMGPVSQYFNAFLFSVAGVSLTTLIWANLLILAGLCFLLFQMFELLGGSSVGWLSVAPIPNVDQRNRSKQDLNRPDRVASCVVVLFFLAVFAFCQQGSLIANYNYVCPYRHEMTHGITLSVTLLLTLFRAVQTPSTVSVLVAGSCLGLVSLMKSEIFVAVAPAAGLCCLLSGCNVRSRAMLLSWLLVGFSAAWLCCWLFLLQWQSGTDALSSMLTHWRLSLNPKYTIQADFYRSLSGISKTDLCAWAMGRSVGIMSVVAGAVVLIDCWIPRAFQRRWLTVTAGFLAYVATNRFVPQSIQRDSVPLSFPAFCLVSLLFHLYQYWTSRDEGARQTAIRMSCWSLFSLLLPLKLFLLPQWGHYGFVLVMPAALLMVFSMVSMVPHLLARQGRGRFVRGVGLGMVVACGSYLWVNSLRIDSNKSMPVGDGGDQFYCEPNGDPRTIPAIGALTWLKSNLRPEETFLVIPDGTLWNYLLRKPQPVPYPMMGPWEVLVYGEQTIVDRVKKARPTVIISTMLNDDKQSDILDPILTDYELIENMVRRSQIGQFKLQIFRLRERELQ